MFGWYMQLHSDYKNNVLASRHNMNLLATVAEEVDNFELLWRLVQNRHLGSFCTELFNNGMERMNKIS